MKPPPLIPIRRSPQVVEGKPSEIAEQLKTLPEHERVTLIIPGEAMEVRRAPPPAEKAGVAQTIGEILAPAHAYTRQSGLSDADVGAFVDSEITVYRAEKRAKAQSANE